MAVAVVDTNVLLDYRDETSPRNDRAQAIVHGIDQGKLPTGHVTNYVVLETMNWLYTRQRHDLAVDTYERLHTSAGFEIHHTPKKDFLGAIDLFRERPGLSFGDATITAYMRRTDVSYLYSFDSDFDGIDGITRLQTAVNPYDADE